MKYYEINIDPRILELLGPNLYTNIYYVLAELIANAYDADASNVYIVIGEDEIRVEDDGHGMSYEAGEVDNYLHVAAVSRTNEDDSYTRSGDRRKMGRKGVGKLAALSVSENVDVLTVASGEMSGFVLSRRPMEGNLLQAIPDEEIVFHYVGDHGSAIVMRKPQYSLHKTMSAIKRNLLKIFPLVSSDFRIHVVRSDEHEIIEAFDENVMGELGTLIALGDDFHGLAALVDQLFPDKQDELVEKRAEKSISVTVRNNLGVDSAYALNISGWIGTYKTTRGRKVEMTDFPDNFISIFANKKMGEFNILPVIGQNKLSEVYVVGQLHADLFELSELPDMALSNRQGYKSDDPRYVALLEYVRSDLLAEILKKRDLFADLGKARKKNDKVESMRRDEQSLREQIESFKTVASSEAADSIFSLGAMPSHEDVSAAIKGSLNRNSPNIGLKVKIDQQKKRLLISQTRPDKPFADIVYQMLLFNNVPRDEILYTNCDDEVCRVPEGYKVFDYLREFFVESYSTQRIFVIFVTSENTKVSWGAITEVGASWITQVDHRIFNIHPFRPEHPLDDEVQWQSTNREEPTRGQLWMAPLNADIFCQKIEAICDAMGYTKQVRSANRSYLDTLVSIRED